MPYCHEVMTGPSSAALTAGSTRLLQGLEPNLSAIAASPGMNPGMQAALAGEWGLGLKMGSPSGSSAEASMKWARPSSASQ